MGPSGQRILQWVVVAVGVGYVADKCIRRGKGLGEAVGPTLW